MIQPFFHEQPNDPIRVKEKVTTTGGSVSDDGVKGFELSSLRQCEHRWRGYRRSCP